MRKLAAFALAAALSIGSAWAACPGCCASNGGISNACAPIGRIFCNDGTVSPTCLCSTCGIASPPGGTPGQLAISPNPVTFASQVSGTTSAPTSVALINVGGQSVLVLGVSSDNGEFIVSNTCSSIAATATCRFSVVFRPTSLGTRTATITVSSTGAGSPQMFTASGAATGASVGPPPEVPPAPPAPPPSSDTIDLIEYHHAAWDHYFITGIPDEIAKLDNGTFSGWSRTGQKFKAYPVTSQQGAVVCRFFSTAFAPRSSHFYTLLPNECAVVRENADWHYEGDVFRIDVAAFNGACPTTAMPVYRLYNDGQGGAPNHRYTIDASLRAQMIAQGWIPEGFGPDGVMMCAPQ